MDRWSGRGGHDENDMPATTSPDGRQRQSPNATPALSRQSTYRSAASANSSVGSSNSSHVGGDDHHHYYENMSPRLMSSPSIASSFVPSGGSYASLRRELSQTGPQSDRNHSSHKINRHDLAKRLTILAQRLTSGEDIDESVVAGQVEQMEKAVSSPGSPSPQLRRQQSMDLRSQSDGGSILGSPIGSMIRSQYSIMSLESLREREREVERAEEELENKPKMGMTIQQAKKVIAESAKLNEDLDNVINNLRARQEEADHINALLIERAERAAQRIVFLQNRIAYLEEELQDNDDEVQHLRICLKAVEIQLPPHPDQELRRCINVFKEDYRALKKKKAGRSSLGSIDSTQLHSSPLRTQTTNYALY